jgi:hypothetical protein
VQGVTDVRQTEVQIAEPLVPEPNAFQAELAIGKLKRHKFIYLLTWICLMVGVYSVKRDVISRTIFSLSDVISRTVFSLRDVTSRPMFATPREY